MQILIEKKVEGFLHPNNSRLAIHIIAVRYTKQFTAILIYQLIWIKFTYFCFRRNIQQA